MSMISNNNLLTFKAISNFVNELCENFGSQQHSLKLYQRLIEKTTITHDKAISKHIDAFKKFCVDNRDAIINKNVSKLNPSHSKIEYSDRVFIDLSSIFRSSDKETAGVIWTHLLTISAIVDPEAKAKDILKKINASGTKEGDFLTDMIIKVSESVDLNSSNPMEMISSLMASGALNDIASTVSNSVKDGSLDLGQLVGTVSKMCQTLGKEEGHPGLEQLDLGSLLSNVTTNFNLNDIFSNIPKDGNTPDLNNLLSSLDLSKLGKNDLTVEEVKSERPPSPSKTEDK